MVPKMPLKGGGGTGSSLAVRPDGTPDEEKFSCPVWVGGKGGGYKTLPIDIAEPARFDRLEGHEAREEADRAVHDPHRDHQRDRAEAGRKLRR